MQVAERVARERAEKIGGMVGYNIRLRAPCTIHHTPYTLQPTPCTHTEYTSLSLSFSLSLSPSLSFPKLTSISIPFSLSFVVHQVGKQAVLRHTAPLLHDRHPPPAHDRRSHARVRLTRHSRRGPAPLDHETPFECYPESVLGAVTPVLPTFGENCP